MWKLNTTILNNQEVKEEIKRENRKYFEMNEKIYYIKNYGVQLTQCLEENV